jgi:hypothetical protein
METLWLKIDFQLPAIAPKSGRQEMEKATARAKFQTSGINRRLLMNRDDIQGFILEHINGVIQIYNVCGINDASAWDLLMI